MCRLAEGCVQFRDGIRDRLSLKVKQSWIEVDGPYVSMKPLRIGADMQYHVISDMVCVK
jgi:hypothetical protein